MKKYLATHPQALALKELGFNEPCIAVFSEKGELSPITNLLPCNSNVPNYATAPLRSQVFDWFRKDYNKLSGIEHSSINGWYFVIREIGGTIDPMLTAVSVGNFKTYEEAESECIDKLIEIVKNGK